jgi:DNA-binding NarL/FixJ family response regulator
MQTRLSRAFRQDIDFEICAQAKDAEEAIRFAIECKPDLVVLNLAMPGVPATKAGNTIREIFRQVPIVLLTTDTRLTRAAQVPSTRIILKEEVGNVVKIAKELVAA